MPLLCELGWHRADPLARWNAGYYFTVCDRCGQDLVRTAYGGWQIPRGYRVVWQSKAPESARAAELIPDGGLDRFAGDQMELPIQEVLRQLEAEESAIAEAAARAAAEDPPETVEPEELPQPVEHVEQVEPAQEAVAAEGDMGPPPIEELAQPVAPPPVRARRSRSAPVDALMDDDWFLKEEPAGTAWDEFADEHMEHSAAARAAAEAGAAEPDDGHEVIADDEREKVGNRSGKIRFGKEVASVMGSGAALFGMFRSRRGETEDASGGLIEDAPEPEVEPVPVAADVEPEPAAEEAQEEERAADPGRARVAVTAAASFGVLILIAAVAGTSQMRSPSGGPTAGSHQPRTDAELAGPTLPQPLETGFVTASLLNCRTSPAEQARTVRRLRRGEPVQILAVEPAWASVSHRGRQCWASTRYISVEEPL